MRVLGGRRGVGAVREGRVSDVVQGEERRGEEEERKGRGTGMLGMKPRKTNE